LAIAQNPTKQYALRGFVLNFCYYDAKMLVSIAVAELPSSDGAKTRKCIKAAAINKSTAIATIIIVNFFKSPTPFTVFPPQI